MPALPSHLVLADRSCVCVCVSRPLGLIRSLTSEPPGSRNWVFAIANIHAVAVAIVRAIIAMLLFVL